MKYLIFLLATSIMLLQSCYQNEDLLEYKQIVQSADKIIFYQRVADTFAIERQVDSSQYLQNTKEILQRNIRPVLPTKFMAKNKIELYKNGYLLGELLISNSKENSCVHFSSKKFSFDFGLTYGIGMSL